LNRKFVFAFSLTVAVALAAATLLLASHRAPSFADVQLRYQSSDRAILDRSGLVVDQVRVDPTVRRLHWVKLENVPPAFVEAILRAEDKRFFYHLGVDPIAFAKALVLRLSGQGGRGASTISMQVGDMVAVRKTTTKKSKIRRNWREKLAQIRRAVALEFRWSKSEILEAYINLIHYRGELQGIAATSYGLFDKQPSGLTRSESAVVAALIRAPNTKVAGVRQRACWLLEAMGHPEECGMITEDHLAHLEEGYRIRPFYRLAPHVARRLVADRALAAQNPIRSTLDRQLQWVALTALQKQIALLQDQNMSDGAVIVVENSTGHVLAYVGNIGAASRASYVDAGVAPRQAGSTLKPFIFAKAIDERILTVASVLEDSPLAISVATGLYQPSNFDRKFRQLVSVRTALASSLNIPAVRALELVGVDAFVRTMNDLGFSQLEQPEFYGPSLALGSADIRLLELTNAYRTLANGGMWSPVQFAPDQTNAQASRRVFSEQSAYVITDVLADRQARVATFGLENTLATRYWTAVKTGTSKDMRDNWTVGFSSKYTVGVWTGNLSGAAMWNVSGIQGAAPVWQEVMNYLHRQEGSLAPEAPLGLVRMPVKFAHDPSADRAEWFLRGTEPSFGTIQAKLEVQSRIAYPVGESVIAMDPDIPKRNHRVFFQIVAPLRNQVVYLNGRRVGRAESLMSWEPQPGAYLLELREGSSGKVLDKVSFQVRGRGVMARAASVSSSVGASGASTAAGATSAPLSNSPVRKTSRSQ